MKKMYFSHQTASNAKFRKLRLESSGQAYVTSRTTSVAFSFMPSTFCVTVIVCMPL